MNIDVGTFEEVCVRGWHTTAYFLQCSIALSEYSSGGEVEEEECVAGIGCSLVGWESGRGGEV